MLVRKRLYYLKIPVRISTDFTREFLYMWVLVRKPDGTEKELDLPEDSYIEIGDILEDGSVVLEIRYTDEDDDLTEMGYFSDERDEDFL